MKTKQRFLSAIVMAIVMMAMSPLKVWADDVEITALSGNPNSENEGYEKLFDGDNTTIYLYSNSSWRLQGHGCSLVIDTYHAW